jgi:hypothetical protein
MERPELNQTEREQFGSGKLLQRRTLEVDIFSSFLRQDFQPFNFALELANFKLKGIARTLSG